MHTTSRWLHPSAAPASRIRKLEYGEYRHRRRSFIIAAALAGVGTLARVPVAAAATTPPLAVWRLNAEWGFPVGPKAKTRCTCRACHGRAANAYFRTEEAALAGRLHPCCVCQPYPETLEGITSDELFGDLDMVDQRDPAVAAVRARVGTGDATAPSSGARCRPRAEARVVWRPSVWAWERPARCSLRLRRRQVTEGWDERFGR